MIQLNQMSQKLFQNNNLFLPGFIKKVMVHKSLDLPLMKILASTMKTRDQEISQGFSNSKFGTILLIRWKTPYL